MGLFDTLAGLNLMISNLFFFIAVCNEDLALLPRENSQNVFTISRIINNGDCLLRKQKHVVNK